MTESALAEAAAQNRAVWTAVEALAERYLAAYERKDAEGCAATFTEGARLDHPYDAPGLGRSEIAAIHEEWFGEDERNKSMRLVEVEPHGSSCFVLLSWSAEIPSPETTAPQTVSGVSHALMRHDEGAWRFHRMALVPDAL